MDVPGPVRVLALVLAAIVLLNHGALAHEQLSKGNDIIAAGHAVVLLLFVVPLTWVAAAPGRAGRVLHDRLGLDLREGSQVVGALVHLAFVYAIFGLTLLSTAFTTQQFLDSGKHPAQDAVIPSIRIIEGLLLNLVFFAVASLTWLYLVDDRGPREMIEDLGLQPKKLLPGIGWGLATTLAVLVALAGLAFVLDQLGYAPQNPQADAIAEALSPELAILVAALAGIGEELYFRGFLLPRTNNLTQAALFGAIHATYLTPLQVILPFLLGLALGYLREKTSLWAAIVTHTAYNSVVLLAAISMSEGGLALFL